MLLPLAARGADESKTPVPTPAVTTPGATADTATTKATKGSAPALLRQAPGQRLSNVRKSYAVEASFAPKIKDLREQLAALEAQRDEQIKAVLTPEQLDKLKAMMAEAKGKSQGKGTTDAPAKSTDSKADRREAG